MQECTGCVLESVLDGELQLVAASIDSFDSFVICFEAGDVSERILNT